MPADWIDAGGIQLRYEFTPGPGRPVVLIHEMGGTLESWDEVAPLLSQCCPVLRYDQRGAGLSEKPPGEMTVAQLAGDLSGLLSALGIREPVAVAGTAVGAAVAAGFAALHPQHAGAAILLSPAMELKGERRTAALQRIDALERQGVRTAFASAVSSAPPRFGVLRLTADPAALAASWRMLADLDMSALLPRIACPTLVAAAIRDSSRPPEYAADIAGSIPGARFVAIEGTHYMAFESPALVAETISTFLTDCGFR
jgi:3-oxoadipate enol-lactonase